MKFKMNRMVTLKISAIVEANSSEEAWDIAEKIPFDNWDIEWQDEDDRYSIPMKDREEMEQYVSSKGS